MKKRYWLRGLLIFGSVGFLFTLKSIGANSILCISPNCGISDQLLIGIRSLPIFFTTAGSFPIYLIAFYVIMPGLVGALLGWLYGKIKNRNKIQFLIFGK